MFRTRRFRLDALVLSLACTLAPGIGRAAEPVLRTVYPGGCQRGSEVEVTLAGSGLENVQALYFSRSGIAVEPIEKERFRIMVDPSAPLGPCDVWVATSEGLAGPKPFSVDPLPGLIETEPNDSPEIAQEVSLARIVDARMDRPADIDWFRFHAERDVSVTVLFRSWSLDGSVEPALVLVGPDGRELAYPQGGRREPILHFRAPRSGEYRLRVCDRAYRKNDYSVYRLTFSVGPTLIGAFPRIVQSGSTQAVDLFGFGLPDSVPMDGDAMGLGRRCVTISAPAVGETNGRGSLSWPGAAGAGFRYRASGLSGSMGFGLSDDPLVSEAEQDNGLREGAQELTLPCHVSGRFLERGDIDWYRFMAKKGEKVRIEAFGERLGRMMDLDVAIHDEAGKALTTLKDLAAPKGAPADAPLASLDPAVTWEPPEDGAYFLLVRDLYGGSVFGADRIYELAIGPAHPSFRVLALHADEKAPHGVSLSRAGKTTVRLIALRDDGFTDPIVIKAEPVPAGLRAEPCVIEAKEWTNTLELQADEDAPIGVFPLRFVAKSKSESTARTGPVVGVALARRGATLKLRRSDGFPVFVRPRSQKAEKDAEAKQPAKAKEGSANE